MKDLVNLIIYFRHILLIPENLRCGIRRLKRITCNIENILTADFIIEKLGIPVDFLPEIVACDKVVGTVTEENPQEFPFSHTSLHPRYQYAYKSNADHIPVKDPV